MSTKTTIFYTKKDEHWYFDCTDYSKSGKNYDVYLELNHSLQDVKMDARTGNIEIRLDGQLAELYGKKEITLIKQIVKWWRFDRDGGFVIQVDGDSDFAQLLKKRTL
jgi:hypothetical protein